MAFDAHVDHSWGHNWAALVPDEDGYHYEEHAVLPYHSRGVLVEDFDKTVKEREALQAVLAKISVEQELQAEGGVQ